MLQKEEVSLATSKAEMQESTEKILEDMKHEEKLPQSP